MMDLPNMIRLAGEHAHRVLIDMQHADLMPQYVLFNAKGGAQVIGCPWSDDAEKAAILGAVRTAAAEFKATALSFVSEVWVTDTREAPDALLVRPSEHPKRREYVFAVATDGRNRQAARWQIIRDRPGGRIIALVSDQVEGDAFSGRIVDGILP